MGLLIGSILKTRGVVECSTPLLLNSFILHHVPLYFSLTTLYSLFPLGFLSVDPSPWMAPPVKWRSAGHWRATRPHGEGKGTGGAGPGSISILGRVERPLRGLGHSPSLLLSAMKLIGTALDSRMHGWVCNACMLKEITTLFNLECNEMLILVMFGWPVIKYILVSTKVP